MSLSPLILTLIIDDKSQDFFNRLRKQHFPAERNYLDAHLTLFHHLPQGNTLIEQTLDQLRALKPHFELTVSDVVSIGNGVAYKIESVELQILHKRLQEKWKQWLIPQDRQKLWPHITIQNKTDANTARQLIDNLKVDFEPFNITALGFNLWEYKGGPWTFKKAFCFK